MILIGDTSNTIQIYQLYMHLMLTFCKPLNFDPSSQHTPPAISPFIPTLKTSFFRKLRCSDTSPASDLSLRFH